MQFALGTLFGVLLTLGLLFLFALAFANGKKGKDKHAKEQSE